MGRRYRVLTRWRAPQMGWTPLYAAAYNGHLKVVQALAKAGANKDAPHKVMEGRGGELGRTNGICVSSWGVAERQLTVSELTRVGGPCHVQARGIALTSPRARSWAGANSWSRFTDL